MPETAISVDALLDRLDRSNQETTMPATATRKSRKPKAESRPPKPESNGEAHDAWYANGPMEAVEGARHVAAGMIRITQLHAHPDNPRKDFDATELASLAESLKKHGVLQPLLVRPIAESRPPNASYQIVCGERRYRAAKVAGLAELPCTVRMLADAEALELMIVENEDREGLNAIELALGLSALCKPIDAGGAGLTQKEAAARFGHEEAWANNLIRLLTLPGEWQKKVAAGELPQTFARTMIPYAKSKEVLKEFEAELKRQNWSIGDRDQFQRQLDRAVTEATRPIEESDKPFWDYELGGGNHGRLFKLTPELEAQLNLCELPLPSGGYGAKRKYATVRRATNVALYDKLQAAAKKEKIEAKAARKGKGKKSGAKDGKAPTAAELKRKREEQDGQLQQRIETWAEDLLRVACCRVLSRESSAMSTTAIGQWLPKWFCQWWLLTYEGDRRGREVFQEAFTRLGGRGCEGDDDRWESGTKWIQADEDPISQVDCLYLGIAAVILNPAGDRRCHLDREVVWSLARLLGIGLAEEWTTASGDRLRDFFAAHTTEQLLDLAKELGDHISAGAKKSVIVDLLAEAHERKPYKLPKVLREAAPVVRRKAK